MKDIESTKHSEISESFMGVNEILVGLQGKIRNHSKIEDSGKINGLVPLRADHPIVSDKQKIALEYKESNKETFVGYIDVQVVLGAIICTYNSQGPIPNGFCFRNRGEKKTLEINGEVISVIGIDINPERRDDAISPTTSLHHELQHHLNTSIGDSMLFQKLDGKYLSIERGSDSGIKSGYRSRSELTQQDQVLLDELFGRSVNLDAPHPSIKTQDYERYENQIYYLDELSANYGQRSSSVFGPLREFYNNRKEGTHYELIGDEIEDTRDLQDLFRKYLMPGLYLQELIQTIERITIRENTVGKILEGWNVGDWQKYVDTLKYIQNMIVQILGTSRTIHQARNLMEKFWNSKVVAPQNGIRTSDIEWLRRAGKQLEIYL